MPAPATGLLLTSSGGQRVVQPEFAFVHSMAEVSHVQKYNVRPLASTSSYDGGGRIGRPLASRLSDKADKLDTQSNRLALALGARVCTQNPEPSG